MANWAFTRWRGLGGALALFVCVPLTFAGCTEETDDYRYRLTVEVETPDGLRSGSSVIEVETEIVRPGSNPAGSAVSWKVRGEAVAVDMPDGSTLFALLRSNNDVEWPARVVPMAIMRGRNLSWEQVYAELPRMDGVQRLPRNWPANAILPERSAYPMLVTFGDISDPTSVMEIDPDNLAATFGEGYALHRITVQITDDPVTTGIEERLGWLPEFYDKMLDGQRLNSIDAENRLANDLSQGAFSKGILQ
ncbi:hypothetical protein [Erythrobacter sp. EC-HK427]|uniref:hypothetical protein n=1 Tax=Erythrobacter sp. EC-HK427 TaxID=2038396 RepID=UPI001252809F|nr:hypothetical protein [Erythrobacter sp. EC-HK427]VVT00678.1 conserved exported hypothetical protein [Erythrobacter sp. EC-HK427]